MIQCGATVNLRGLSTRRMDDLVQPSGITETCD
jgi:hypothetical protein